MVNIVERPVLIVALSLALIVPIWSTLPALAQPTPDMVIQRMDQDGDGKVSQKEFMGRRKPFSFFDRNGDGYATREEIAASMQEARGLQSPQNSGASGDSGFLQSTQVQNLLAGSHVSHISPKKQTLHSIAMVHSVPCQNPDSLVPGNGGSKGQAYYVWILATSSTARIFVRY